MIPTARTTLVTAALMATAALSSSTLAESATITIGSVGAAPGTTVRVPVTMSTEDTVGAFDFTIDSAGRMVDDIDYAGLLFLNGWDGWDTAPATNANISAACIFPQDQVTGFDLPLIDLLLEIPADATPGSTFTVSMSSFMVTDYTFTPFDVTLIEGEIVIISDGCDEDIDGDSEVGFTDLIAVLSSWGPCRGCDADFDASGDVGLSDLLRVLASWGVCP